VNQERHLKLSVHNVNLPSSLSELVSWTRHRFHALTTLRSITSANSVMLSVGLGLCVCVHLVLNLTLSESVINGRLSLILFWWMQCVPTALADELKFEDNNEDGHH